LIVKKNKNLSSGNKITTAPGEKYAEPAYTAGSDGWARVNNPTE
jgi:hypothetical protein